MSHQFYKKGICVFDDELCDRTDCKNHYELLGNFAAFLIYYFLILIVVGLIASLF